MKRAGRLLSLLLLVATLFSLTLAGCGTTQTDSDKPAAVEASATGTEAAVSEAPAAEPRDPYEVKWYFAGNKHFPDTEEVEKAINEKVADLNTTVKIQVYPWGEYPDKMSMIISSGDKFDMCFMGTWTNYYPHVAQGAFVDVTDLVAKNLPKYSQVLAPQFLEGPKVKGRLYGLPTNKEIPEAYGFEVDTDMAKQIGADFSNVKTYEDLEPILKLAKEKLPSDIIPMHLQSTTVFRDGTFDNLGDVKIPGVVRMDDPSGKVINQFESPEFMKYWKLAYKWVQAGYANKDASTQGAPDYWANGKAFTRLENLGPISEYIGTKGQTIKRIYIGDKVIATGSTVGALTCFSRTSGNVDRAMEFFDRVATDSDIYNLVAFGIEGKHYQVLDANTNPKRIDFINGQTEDTVGYIHSGGAWSMGGNWFLSYLNKIEPANRNEMVEEFNKTGKTSALLGYSFDPEPVKNEIAACANVYSELAISLNTGAVDPDKYASELVTKMKEAGADKIIAEKQKQIDQWKKDNNK